MGKTNKAVPWTHDVSFGSKMRPAGKPKEKRVQNNMFKNINQIYREVSADNPMTSNFKTAGQVSSTKITSAATGTNSFHPIASNLTIISKSGKSQRQRKKSGGN